MFLKSSLRTINSLNSAKTQMNKLGKRSGIGFDDIKTRINLGDDKHYKAPHKHN